MAVEANGTAVEVNAAALEANATAMEDLFSAVDANPTSVGAILQHANPTSLRGHSTIMDVNFIVKPCRHIIALA